MKLNFFILILYFMFGVIFFSCQKLPHCFDCSPISWFPIHTAAKNGDVEEIRRLLKQGADIHSRAIGASTPGLTALHIATIHDHPEAVSFLISKGAEVNARDTYGRTPLYEAKSVEVAKILLKNDADVHTEDYINNFTPLHNVKSVEIATVLLENDSELNTKSDGDWTPLHVKILEKQTTLALFFINQGADIHIQNTDGNTPLHLAVEKEETEVAKLIFQKGGNPYTKNKEKNNPFSMAKDKDNQELIELFETYVPETSSA